MTVMRDAAARDATRATDPRGVFALAVKVIQKADRKAGRQTEAKYSVASLPPRRQA